MLFICNHLKWYMFCWSVGKGEGRRYSLTSWCICPKPRSRQMTLFDKKALRYQVMSIISLVSNYVDILGKQRKNKYQGT